MRLSLFLTHTQRRAIRPKRLSIVPKFEQLCVVWVCTNLGARQRRRGGGDEHTNQGVRVRRSQTRAAEGGAINRGIALFTHTKAGQPYTGGGRYLLSWSTPPLVRHGMQE